MMKGMHIKLNFDEYRDKVYACWIGKNIGGTMGAPYEGTKEYLDVKGFATREGEVLPNDDLDLQLVWLIAAEHVGVTRVNAKSLAEHWLMFVTPHWNEYGIGKANLKMGLLPPLSGDYHNDWKHSNGAWIRTEIWSCINPGRPDVAAKYAIEDACVDHGTGEGTYAAIFVAALQASAFVLSDLRQCIEVALAKIPAESRMAQSVRLTMECYDKGMSAHDTRTAIQQSNADIGDGWFEAPSNVSYVVLGLLYGEGDFKKSMIEAINCGDDTDCTAGTVGATFGILHGTKGIPKDWSRYIGDEIVTLSIDRGTLSGVPKSCTELTDRVVALAQRTVSAGHLYPIWNGDDTVRFTDGENEFPENAYDTFLSCNLVKKRLEELLPNSFTETCDYVRVTAVMDEGVDIVPNSELKFRLQFHTNHYLTQVCVPLRLHVRFLVPDGFSIQGRKSALLSGYQPDRRPGNAYAEEEYVLTVGESVEPRNRVIAEITADGHVQSVYLPIVLIG
jgi:ADP-ribosylglycohydrolase